MSVGNLFKDIKDENRPSLTNSSPRSFENGLKLLDVDPLEIARQLTLIEHELFMNIKVKFII